MNCPFCGDILKIGGMKRIETLIEHVSDPNSEPTEKVFYVCECGETENCFWDEFGDFYVKDYDKYNNNRLEYCLAINSVATIEYLNKAKNSIS